MSSLAIRLHVNLSVPLSMWDSMDTVIKVACGNEHAIVAVSVGENIGDSK
jgi:hypothetical protein